MQTQGEPVYGPRGDRQANSQTDRCGERMDGRRPDRKLCSDRTQAGRQGGRRRMQRRWREEALPRRSFQQRTEAWWHREQVSALPPDVCVYLTLDEVAICCRHRAAIKTKGRNAADYFSAQQPCALQSPDA